MNRLSAVAAQMGRAFVNAFERSMEMSGRSSRTDYWGFTGICFLISMGGVLLDKQLHLTAPLLGIGYVTLVTSIMTLVPQCTLMIRRLHDANFSGWWSLFTLVPVFGMLAVLVFACLPPTPGANRFGAPRPV